jgi:hypothetical protein
MLETMIHITWRGSATITTGYLAGGVVSLSSAIIPGQRKESADRFSTNVLPVIREIQRSGIKSLRDIARALAARGIPTARGGAWTPVQVSAFLQRAS